MGQTDLYDYENLYLQTAKEYAGKISVSLDHLLSNVLDKDALNNLHIASHSLRSQSQVMGFTNITDICLSIEKVSNDALKGIGQLNNQSILDFKKSTEKLREILKQAQDDVRILPYAYHK